MTTRFACRANAGCGSRSFFFFFFMRKCGDENQSDDETSPPPPPSRRTHWPDPGPMAEKSCLSCAEGKKMDKFLRAGESPWYDECGGRLGCGVVETRVAAVACRVAGRTSSFLIFVGLACWFFVSLCANSLCAVYYCSDCYKVPPSYSCVDRIVVHIVFIVAPPPHIENPRRRWPRCF